MRRCGGRCGGRWGGRCGGRCTSDGDASPHAAVYITVVPVRPPTYIEGVRVSLSPAQYVGAERSVVRRHGVPGAVPVDPDDPRPPTDGDVGRPEAEVLDIDPPR